MTNPGQLFATCRTGHVVVSFVRDECSCSALTLHFLCKMRRGEDRCGWRKSVLVQPHARLCAEPD